MQERAVSAMKSLGLSEPEATVYLLLLSAGPMSAYRLAQRSGIARANIYPLLERLQKRGAVVPIEQGGGNAYAPLPVKEMLARLSQRHEAALVEADEALHTLAAPQPDRVSWNLEGEGPILAKASAMLGAAEHDLLIGLSSQESAKFAPALSELVARGVAVTTLCLQGCERECGTCRGTVYRYPLASQETGRWLVLTMDQKEILVAQFPLNGLPTGTYSKLPVLVELGGHYIRNAIGIAEIVRSMGPRLLQSIDQRALSALAGAGLAVGKMSLFAHFLSVVASTSETTNENG